MRLRLEVRGRSTEGYMRKITLADRLRYRFDNTISRGTVALIGWLFVVLAALVVLSSLVVYATGVAPEVGGRRPGFLETLWLSLMRTIDPGGVGGDQGNWPFLISMLAITAGGILVFSTLIGIIFTGIDDKLDRLRKGRSFVVERGHTVIYGWSPEVFSVVSELVVANESRKNACVAILADKDKVEMEDEIRDRVGKSGTTRIVCRTGNPIDVDDLEIVNPHEARSIIVLPPEGEDADSRVIKTILALTNNPGRREEPYHIVSRMHGPENLGVARMVGGPEVELVPVDDLIARITAQTCRQSGLSVVYTDLLDFGGDEIYFVQEPDLVGRTFGEALFAYESSSAIGLRAGDGRLHLNPPAETEISAGDALVLIAEDDSSIALSEIADPDVSADAIRKPPPRDQRPERTLILGWNDRGSTMVDQLNRYVPPGSEITVVAPEDTGVPARFDGLEHQTVSSRAGDTSDRRTLDGLDVHSYDNVIVLSHADGSRGDDADSKTLVTLLHLREIAEQSGRNFSIVSEMLDDRNRELAEIARADDFIVSDRLVSLMMCQVSENKEYSAVFEELIDPSGSELYLKPADEYVDRGVPLTFYTVVEAARRRGEVAVGYRVGKEAGDPRRSYGVRLNPDKSRRITLAKGDRVIVLAES